MALQELPTPSQHAQPSQATAEEDISGRPTSSISPRSFTGNSRAMAKRSLPAASCSLSTADGTTERDRATALPKKRRTRSHSASLERSLQPQRQPLAALQSLPLPQVKSSTKPRQQDTEPPQTAMAIDQELTCLPRFCSYLEHRLQTQHIDLLRAFVHDYIDAKETRLCQFLQLACDVIAVLPLANADATKRRAAQEFLREQREEMEANWPTTLTLGSSCFVAYLNARVVVKHVSWLHKLFRDFMVGKEQNVLEFLDRGCEVVSVLPYDLDQSLESPLRGAPDSKWCKSSMASGAVVTDAAGGNVESAEAALFRELERFFDIKKPWQVVFRDYKQFAPFGQRVMSDKLTRMLHKFWHKHARAVWERNFWLPYHTKEISHSRRKLRQANARRAFEGIMVQVYHEFGAQVFLELDETQRIGWWYRKKVWNLSTVRHRDNLDGCQKYVDTYVYEWDFSRVHVDPDGRPLGKAFWMQLHPMWDQIQADIQQLQESHDSNGFSAKSQQDGNRDGRQQVNVKVQEEDEEEDQMYDSADADETADLEDDDDDDDDTGVESDGHGAAPAEEREEEVEMATDISVEIDALALRLSQFGISFEEFRGSFTEQACMAEIFCWLEEQQPWRQVYGSYVDPLASLVQVADPVVADEIQSHLRQFWATHAQEVFERRFWVPIVRGTSPWRSRRDRHTAALRVFGEIVELVHSSCGVQTFVSLENATAKPLFWWFYEPVINLHTVYKQLGAQKSKKYVEDNMFRSVSVPLEAYGGDSDLMPRSSWTKASIPGQTATCVSASRIPHIIAELKTFASRRKHKSRTAGAKHSRGARQGSEHSVNGVDLSASSGQRRSARYPQKDTLSISCSPRTATVTPPNLVLPSPSASSLPTSGTVGWLSSLTPSAKASVFYGETHEIDWMINLAERFQRQTPWSRAFTSIRWPPNGTWQCPGEEPLQLDAVLVDMLQMFWRDHAEAVWERKFWLPLRSSTKVSKMRVMRQEKAAREVELMVERAYKLYGVSFFRRLDKQRVDWWWYREPPVHLLAVFRQLGAQSCQEYIARNETARHPELLAIDFVAYGNHANRGKQNPKSPSLWLARPIAYRIGEEMHADKALPSSRTSGSKPKHQERLSRPTSQTERI